MAFDTNLLFSNAATITDDRFGTAVAINKTPLDGVWIEVVVTSAAVTTGTMDITVYESTDSTQSTSADAALAVFPQITAAGRHLRKVQSKKAYLGLRYDVGGTSPSFVVTAGIVTGPLPDTGA